MDDRITELITGEESTYERVRLARRGAFTQPLPAKLRYAALLCLAVAVSLPELYLLPTAVRERWLGDPLAAAPTVALVALVALAFVFVPSLGIAAVAARLAGLEAVSERQAHALLTVEELCSWFGFVSGGLAVVVLHGLLAAGLAGTGAIEALVATGVANPFATSEVGLTLATVAGAATLCAATLFVLGEGFADSLAARGHGGAGGNGAG